MQTMKAAVQAQLGTEPADREVAAELDNAKDWDETVVAMMMLSRDELIRVAEALGLVVAAAEKRRISKTKVLERLHAEIFLF
jgi:hypothetical protein